MASLCEVYLATLWKYHPDAVKRTMYELTIGTKSLEGVQIMYDAEYHWFKVNCRPEHLKNIRQLFDRMAADIEDEVFDDHSEIINQDGVLKPSIKTDLIVYDDVSYDASRSIYSLEPYTYPASFTLAYKTTWNKLEDERSLTIHNLLRPDEFDRLKKDAKLEMEYNSTGKLVYIGSNDYQGAQKVKAKLDVLLVIGKLPPPRPEHLLYTENHSERLRVQMTADVRYMTNIDPNLTASTLLDPAFVANLENAYQKMYEQGASVRLCIYDESRGRHFSMYGPKIKVRGGMVYPLGNRPPIHLKAVDKGAVKGVKPPTSPSHSAAQADKHAFIKAIEPVPSPTRASIQADKDAQVSKWIDEIPAHSTMAPLETDSQLSATEKHGGVHSTSNTGSAGKNLDDVRSIATDLERFKNMYGTSSGPSQSSSKNQQDTPGMSDSSASVTYDELVKQAIMEDRPIPVKKPEPPQMPKKTGPGDAKGDPKGDANPPSTTHSALEAKPRQPPITWSMDPLVPLVVQATAGSGSSTTPGSVEGGQVENDGDENSFQRYREPGAKGFGTMDQQGGKVPKVITSASTIHKGIGTRQQDLASQHPLTPDFDQEIIPAIRRLLVSCPYKRGKVTVRADFGRIILGGMDQSAMAFNSVKTPSNGWKKPHLQKTLNEHVVDRGRIHFTRVLSTFGSDLEHMINMTDGPTGNRLWQPVPYDGWVVYSFRCLYREGERELPFLVDLKYGYEGKDYSYEIRPFNSANDGVTPLYVHDLLRSWDLRVTLTHTDSAIFEEILGRIVQRFLKSVQITKFEAEGIDLRFALANKDLFVHEVRVITKWRYSSANARSELEVAEVVPLVTRPVPGQKTREYISQLPNKKDIRTRTIKGVYPRWYEASVVSTALEKLFKENETLPFAETTSWSLDTLENFQGHNALRAIYEPALQMLKQMDLVGGMEENNMPQEPQYEVRRPNDEQDVPGLAKPQPSPAQHVRQESLVSARDADALARARWDAYMDDMKKQNKTFW